MAKMFYTMDETKAALGKSEEQVKQFASEGRLREFRDGARLMFKADQVEHLKTEIASGSEPLDLAADDSGLAIGLNEPKDSGGSTGGLELADEPSGASTAGGIPTPTQEQEDTALASDLGLSGSVSGLPSSGRALGGSVAGGSGLAGSGLGSSAGGSGLGGASGSRSGIDIFDTEEPEKVDPSAATSIAPGINPDISIESVGSGSGLLDLTRESDDTSLGAELLDEIAPGASGVRRPPSESALAGSAMGASGIGSSAGGTGIGMSEPRGLGAAPRAAVPALIEAPDPMAPAFGMAALGATGVVLFAAFALMCGLADNHPDILKRMGSGAPGGFSFWIVVLLALALPLLMFVIGLLVAKMGRPKA